MLWCFYCTHIASSLHLTCKRYPSEGTRSCASELLSKFGRNTVLFGAKKALVLWCFVLNPQSAEVLINLTRTALVKYINFTGVPNTVELGAQDLEGFRHASLRRHGMSSQGDVSPSDEMEPTLSGTPGSRSSNTFTSRLQAALPSGGLLRMRRSTSEVL